MKNLICVFDDKFKFENFNTYFIFSLSSICIYIATVYCLFLSKCFTLLLKFIGIYTRIIKLIDAFINIFKKIIVLI